MTATNEWRPPWWPPPNPSDCKCGWPTVPLPITLGYGTSFQNAIELRVCTNLGQHP